MLDRNKIVEEADALSVAQYLGMDIVRKGSYNFIACPGHQKRLGRTDDNISNCVLTPKGYHCFACGVKVGLIDMVMEYMNCSYPEALSIIADSCGGVSLYTLDDKNISTKKQLPLSQEDLEIIGLVQNGTTTKTINATDAYDEEVEDSIIRKGFGEYLVGEKVGNTSLIALMQADENMYNQLVLNKAEEAVKKYSDALEKYSSRDSEGALEIYELFNENGSLDNEVFFGVKNAIQRKLNRAKEILEQQKKKIV